MPAPMSGRRKAIGALLLLAALGAGVFAFWRARRDRATVPNPALLVHVHEGFRYEYHVPTGREGLYDAALDPRGIRNVLAEHREVAAICRHVLEQEQQVESLDVLRERYAEEIRRLRALGYL